MKNLHDVLKSPKYEARKLFIKSADPVAGKLRFPGWPFNTEEGNKLTLSPAPLIGEHNLLVMGSNGLGLDKKHLELLRAIKAI